MGSESRWSRAGAAGGRPPIVVRLRVAWRGLAGAAAVAALLTLGGCAEMRYYAQAVEGHLQVVRAARPVDAVLDDAATPAPLRAQLVLAQEIRAFAVQALRLPDNTSYRRYADLGRSHVVWNVVAAPPFALTPRQWCPPFLGCMSYRGFFAEAPAREWAQALQRDGWETSVYGVPAYSTLGWTEWLGGDPLLNTFIHYPEAELARMVFHELAHQLIYVGGDTAFNEAFATAVERIGARQWLARRAAAGTIGPAAGAAPPAAEPQALARQDARRQQFRALAGAVRAQLTLVFEGVADPMQGDPVRAARKAAVLRTLHEDYAALKARIGGPAREWSGYDAWIERVNTASLAAQGTYEDLAPAFEALFAREASHGAEAWPRFYDAVRALGALPRAERHAALRALMPPAPAAP